MSFENYFSPTQNYDCLVGMVDVMLELNNPPQADSPPKAVKKTKSSDGLKKQTEKSTR